MKTQQRIIVTVAALFAAAAALAQPAVMRDAHSLVFGHQAISRTVELLPNGVRTVSTTSDPALVPVLQRHPREMVEHLKDGGMVRRWDPLFAELAVLHDKVDFTFEDLDNGIAAVSTSDDPDVVLLIQAHAQKVSEMVTRGPQAMREETPLPLGYTAKENGVNQGRGRGQGGGKGLGQGRGRGQGGGKGLGQGRGHGQGGGKGLGQGDGRGQGGGKGLGQGDGRGQGRGAGLGQGGGRGQGRGAGMAQGGGRGDRCGADGPGRGLGNATGRGYNQGPKFLDNNGDGVNDNFADRDGDGLCDSCQKILGLKGTPGAAPEADVPEGSDVPQGACSTKEGCPLTWNPKQ